MGVHRKALGISFVKFPRRAALFGCLFILSGVWSAWSLAVIRSTNGVIVWCETSKSAALNSRGPTIVLHFVNLSLQERQVYVFPPDTCSATLEPDLKLSWLAGGTSSREFTQGEWNVVPAVYCRVVGSGREEDYFLLRRRVPAQGDSLN